MVFTQFRHRCLVKAAVQEPELGHLVFHAFFRPVAVPKLAPVSQAALWSAPQTASHVFPDKVLTSLLMFLEDFHAITKGAALYWTPVLCACVRVATATPAERFHHCFKCAEPAPHDSV